MSTAISRKVVGKSARDNPDRHCGWFRVLFFSKKFERIGTKGLGNVFASAKGKQQKYSRSLSVVQTATVARNSVLIIPHFTFRDCRVHIFSDNLSRSSCIDKVIRAILFVHWSNGL